MIIHPQSAIVSPQWAVFEFDDPLQPIALFVHEIDAKNFAIEYHVVRQVWLTLTTYDDETDVRLGWSVERPD